MPTAPRRHCLRPSCPALAVQGGYCAAHAARQTTHGWDTGRRPDVRRLAGRANQERRRRLFSRQPLCVLCEREGRVTLAVIADHVTPLAEGGADSETNLQALCQSCSDKKTRGESMRGKARVR